MSGSDCRKGARRPTAAALTIAALMIVLALGGCGRKGNPQPPAGEPNTYPRAYPSE